MSLFNHYFGTKKSFHFDNNLSIYDNFNELCSLPFFKPRSEATKKLARVLKFCVCHSFKDNVFAIENQQERENQLWKDLINLELAKRAIDDWEKWHKIHNKKSERYEKMNYFKNIIHSKQYELIRSDNIYFQRHRIGRTWNNPLINLQNHEFFLDKLSKEQKNAYETLAQLNIPKEVSKKNFRPKPFSCFAILASCLNYFILDWNFNYIFDFTTSYFV